MTWHPASPRPPRQQITVDGDTSTNDTVIGLASGVSGTPKITDAGSTDGKALEAAVTALLQVGVPGLGGRGRSNQRSGAVGCRNVLPRLACHAATLRPATLRAWPRRLRGTAKAPHA
jgi:hypothetical protein